jgi:quercetin dioxygenase-like cupin family protein
MQLKPAILFSGDKLKTITGRSEYIFHFASQPLQEDLCYFEGFFEEPGPKAGLHLHKTITEIFTVTEGEFTFHLSDGSQVMAAGDTIIAQPFQPHGFSTNCPRCRMHILSIGFPNRENFFIELARMATGEIKPGPAEMDAFFNRFDQYNL